MGPPLRALERKPGWRFTARHTYYGWRILWNYSFANLQDNILEKFISTKTLSFSFIQKIGQNEEMGNCFIKYPLLMKCNYEDVKKKSIISNGETVAIIKRKYKQEP